MAKPVIKFKTYRQSSQVGGKIYGVPNLGDTVVASVTMQEVIDYAKLHNYSAASLEALLSQVISGVADLVARDGKPRNLSDLLKFEPVIKGTFDNLEQTVTNQKVIVRPRMLKEIKLALNAGDYSWQNQNDSTSPRLVSAAPISSAYSVPDLASFTASITSPYFGWTLAGSRLAPNGNTDFFNSFIRFAVILRRLTNGVLVDHHFESIDYTTVSLPSVIGEPSGLFTHLSQDEATDNVFELSQVVSLEYGKSWTFVDGVYAADEDSIVPMTGDVLIFQFRRTTSTGDTFTVEKSYTL